MPEKAPLGPEEAARLLTPEADRLDTVMARLADVVVARLAERLRTDADALLDRPAVALPPLAALTLCQTARRRAGAPCPARAAGVASATVPAAPCCRPSSPQAA